MKTSVRTQFVIDGAHFPSMKMAYGAAQRLGFAGCLTAFEARLHRGASTWAELLAPLNASASRNAKHMSDLGAAKREAERLEMLAMCDELDLRKAALRAVA